MASGPSTAERVRLLIRDALSIDVPDGQTDLIDSGLLDSLALVTLIAEIEQEFGIELRLDEFDPDRFRSVDRIEQFLIEAYPAVR
jgi:acyl carrier protein